MILLSKPMRESKNQCIFKSALKELSCECKLVDVALSVWKWQNVKMITTSRDICKKPPSEWLLGSTLIRPFCSDCSNFVAYTRLNAGPLIDILVGWLVGLSVSCSVTIQFRAVFGWFLQFCLKQLLLPRFQSCTGRTNG